MRHLLFAAGVFLSASAHAANDYITDITLEDADLSNFRLTMLQGDQPVGFMEYGWTRKGDTYVIRDRTEMLPNIVETAEGVLDAATLMPTSVTIDFAIGENKLDLDLAWKDGWRQGQYISHRDGKTTTRDVNLKEDTPATLRLAVFGMIPALPLREGYATIVPWFNTLANRGEDIAVSVVATETVETPAGTFEAFKVALQGGTPENFVYVTKAKPRRIVRIDVVGQPMHFLASGEPTQYLD